MAKNKGKKGVVASVVAGVVALSKVQCAAQLGVDVLQSKACKLPKIHGAKNAIAVAAVAMFGERLAGYLLLATGILCHNASVRSGNPRALTGELDKQGRMHRYAKFGAGKDTSHAISEKCQLAADDSTLRNELTALHNAMVAGSDTLDATLLAELPADMQVSMAAAVDTACANYRKEYEAKLAVDKLAKSTDTTIAATVAAVEPVTIADELAEQPLQ